MSRNSILDLLLFNKALAKLVEINPFYANISICDDWEENTKASDPELWDLLTNNNGGDIEGLDSIVDSDDELDNNPKNQTKQTQFPTPRLYI